MKTLDINAKTWFDKVNGNSYFSGRVVVDYGMETQKEFVMPFQYGYGSQYESEAFALLKREGVLAEGDSRYCRENGIILRSNNEKNCLRRTK